jgi:hypothetical protein
MTERGPAKTPFGPPSVTVGMIRFTWRAGAGDRRCGGAVRPFDPDAIVEVVVELLITSLRCAAQLDPQIDVSNAVAKLADLTA